MQLGHLQDNFQVDEIVFFDEYLIIQQESYFLRKLHTIVVFI